MVEMKPAALRDCLLTRERDRVTLRIGGSAPTCSTPPFDSAPPELALWSWSWSDWPTFNRSVFDQDLKRILRWYRARGFYDAQIRDVRVTPEAAAHGAPCRDSTCRAELRVLVAEGEPVVVNEVVVQGVESQQRKRAKSGEPSP